MKDFAVTDAAFAGWGTIRRHPVSVLVWGLLYALFLLLVFVGFAGPIVRAFAVFSKPEVARQDPQLVMSVLGGVMGGYVFFLLGALVLGAVVAGAVLRAFFQPEDKAFFFLRLGTRELWLLLTTFVQSLVIGGAQFVAGFIIGLVSAAASVASPEIGGIVRVIGQLATYALAIYLVLRLSMGVPMTYVQSNFRLFESWSMTQGAMTKLLLTWLLVLVVSLVIYFVAAIIFGFGAAGSLMHLPGLKDPQAFFARPATVWAADLAPAIGVAAVLCTVVIGTLSTLSYTSFAFIYRQLNPDADVSATFS